MGEKGEVYVRVLDRTIAPWELTQARFREDREENGLKFDADKPLGQPRPQSLVSIYKAYYVQ